MTATIVEAETNLTVFESEDFEVACEAISGCDNSAVWKVRVKCCNGLWLLCQSCVDELIEQISDNGHISCACGKCNAKQPLAEFVDRMDRL